MHVLTQLTLRHPKRALILLGLLTLAFGWGLRDLRTEFGYRILVGDDHPAIRNLENFVERFGGGSPIVIAWSCGGALPCRDAFDDSSLGMAQSLSNELRTVSGISRVEGISSSALLMPDPTGWAVRRFVEDGEPVRDREALAERAIVDPLWKRLVSADRRVGAVVVQPVDTRATTSLHVIDAIERALEPHRRVGFEFQMVGDAVMEVLNGRELAGSMRIVVPLTVLVIGIVGWAFTRWLAGITAALATVGIALLWTLGLLGWIGWPRDSILEVLAPLILTIGVCDAVHMLSRFEAERARTANENVERADLLLAAARQISRPCVITTLTTGAALFSFVTSGLDTFVRFGVISALGTGACLVLTFTLLPALLNFVPLESSRAGQATRAWTSGLNRAVRISAAHSRAILLTAALVTAISAIGWGWHLDVDTDWDKTFGEQSQAVRWARFVRAHLASDTTLEVEITLPEDQRAESPITLGILAELSSFLRSVDGLSEGVSVQNLVARANRLVHADDSSFEQHEDSESANAQLLELIGLGGPDLLSNWMSLDRSVLRVSSGATRFSYSQRAAIVESVEAYLRAKFPAEWRTRLTGGVPLVLEWMREVRGTQLRSFPTAFALVLIIVAASLRSLRMGLAAMVPAVVPVVLTLGTMGWVGMDLDIGRAMVAAVVIGIAVDDGVHLLSHYQVRRAAGAPPVEAMQDAVLHTGRAVITTSVALGLGFLTLLGSAWSTISSFGLCVALAILVALVASLLVLPALFFGLEGAPVASDVSGQNRTPGPDLSL